MTVLYNSVHFTLFILLLRAKVNDQISWACARESISTPAVVVAGAACIYESESTQNTIAALFQKIKIFEITW